MENCEVMIGMLTCPVGEGTVLLHYDLCHSAEGEREREIAHRFSQIE